AGGHAIRLDDREAAIEHVLELVHKLGARQILVGSGAFIDSLGLRDRLKLAGCAAHSADVDRDLVFAAELSISGVDCLVSDTGSVVLLARHSETRWYSLLPLVHVAVAS